MKHMTLQNLWIFRLGTTCNWVTLAVTQKLWYHKALTLS